MADTKTTMWRSVRQEEYPSGVIVDDKPVAGVLYPDFEPKPITGGARKGQYRNPDVDTVVVAGETLVEPGGGTSLFDKRGVFGHKYWFYFEIPQGTVIPDSLKITGPDWNGKFSANHYQIEARTRIAIAGMKGALDNFARNAVVRKVRLAKG